MKARLETTAHLWLNETELVQALDELVEIVEVACSCGDLSHASHQVRLRIVTATDPLVELMKEVS